MIYIAGPYSHEDLFIRHERYISHREYLAYMLAQYIPTFSPIVQCHEAALWHNLPTDAEFWQWYNRYMIDRSEVVHVLKLEGWDKSIGVQGEIDYCVETSKPCELIEVPWPV